jgi:PAS domain S-box-containing protein
VVVEGKGGPQVFTLQGAEHPYRVLIESMNEGALTLAAGQVILYANQCFARLVKCPLDQVMGHSVRRFLTVADRATLRALLKQAKPSGSKMQAVLLARGGSKVPVQISIRSLERKRFKDEAVGLVVTDMTEARRTEEMLRALTRRVVQVQETERGHVALELHDNITQHLCAILARWQALATTLKPDNAARRVELMKLSAMLGHTVGEVQRIARNLRPSILDELGLVPALRATCQDFARRTGVKVRLACPPLANRLPAEMELALYRILQKALENVEKHARARHVFIRLRQRVAIQLAIRDDGIGFDPERHAARQKGTGGLDLLSMRERATYVGGTLRISSSRGAGTRLEVLIPLPPASLPSGPPGPRR